MRRAISAAVVLAAVAVALVLVGASGDQKRIEKTYEIELDSAFGLVDGGDFKVGGVKAGTTTGFELTRREPYRVIVTAEVSEPGFDSLRADARCEVRQQSLIGEYFVDCDSGRSEKHLPDGGRVPVARTASTVPPDLINTIQRKPQRERFRLILSELGTGLAGRPQELNEVIRRAHPALRELTETIGVLRAQNRTISAFIANSDQVSQAVHPVREQVARWAEEAADLSVIQGARSEQIGRYWNKVPEFLAELQPTMAELDKTATAQIPALRKLGGAAPELTAFLKEAEPFAKATRGSIDDLGESSEAGVKALRRSRDEIRELRALSVNAPTTAKPLRQFLETIDDRQRSTENDPQARISAPPAPDKTAYTEGHGFTGMEGLLNYIYFQTLGINVFDEFGHLLRIGIFTLGNCSPYSAKPSPALQKQCGSYTGPYQPGVNAPDPTRNGVAAAEAAERAGPAPTRPESQPRGAGEPEAPPVAGLPDPSNPQPALPEGVRDLIDNLSGALGGKKKNPAAQQAPSPANLLDFLLAP